MSYLVYCPTCNGKMSVNAETCPHCGEYKFIEREWEMEKIPCNNCGGDLSKNKFGRGFVSENYANSEDVKITSTPPEGFECFSCSPKQYEYIDTNDRYVSVRKSLPKSTFEKYKNAILKGEYEVLHYYRTGIIKFKYGRTTCSSCNGLGYWLKESYKVKSVIDRRKRV